ncbi:DUF6157 family protein [Geodermatophilus sp. SYSU D00815]
MATTNYQDTFIEVAEDSRATSGEVPPPRNGAPTVAGLQYAMLADAPYVHTSDDVLFEVHAQRRGVPAAEREAEREAFFSKGQPCFRASPLTKQYGWGVHCDGAGRIALVAVDSPEYAALAADPALRHLRAMRAKRA